MNIYNLKEYLFFNIYICTYMTVTDREGRRSRLCPLFLLSNARQCFSDAIGEQYLVCLHPGVLEYTW